MTGWAVFMESDGAVHPDIAAMSAVIRHAVAKEVLLCGAIAQYQGVSVTAGIDRFAICGRRLGCVVPFTKGVFGTAQTSRLRRGTGIKFRIALICERLKILAFVIHHFITHQ